MVVHTTQKDQLIFILEGKVESLGEEVSDDISQVTTPEGQDCLFLGDTQHTVYNALILLICQDLPAGMLHLQQQLDPLSGCYRHLGDGRGHSTNQEVLGEGHSSICHVERKKEKAGGCRKGLG